MVEYAPGYLADHWCTYILLCIEGETETELQDGRDSRSYQSELSSRR